MNFFCYRGKFFLLVILLFFHHSTFSADCGLELEDLSDRLKKVQLTEAQKFEMVSHLDKAITLCFYQLEEKALEEINLIRKKIGLQSNNESDIKRFITEDSYDK